MTDPKDRQAPERVWRVSPYTPVGYLHGLPTWPQKKLAGPNAVEYVRADLIPALIAEAVEAERERCAKVAELAPYKREAMVCGCSEGLADFIAAAIRHQGEGDGNG